MIWPFTKFKRLESKIESLRISNEITMDAITILKDEINLNREYLELKVRKYNKDIELLIKTVDRIMIDLENK